MVSTNKFFKNCPIVFLDLENKPKSVPASFSWFSKFLCWNISTLSQVSNCDGVVLEIYLDHKFQWTQEDLNCESLAYKVVT